MTGLAWDLWWLAWPLTVTLVAIAALRELLRPPRHVQRLEARIAKLEAWGSAEHARVMRLDTAVRTVEADVAGVVDDLAPIDPPADTERVPWDGWPNLVLASSGSHPNWQAVSGVAPWHEPAPLAADWRWRTRDRIPTHGYDIELKTPAPDRPTMELAAVRNRRPPVLPTSIPEALALNDRPLTLAQLAGALGRDSWELRPELNDLIRAGAVRFAATHDHESSYELETP